MVQGEEQFREGSGSAGRVIQRESGSGRRVIQGESSDSGGSTSRLEDA
jgi:hypothetical protein